MEHKLAKYGIWGTIIATILAALITGGVTLYTYYDGKPKEKQILELEKQASQKKTQLV